jgi:hypothetical protein
MSGVRQRLHSDNSMDRQRGFGQLMMTCLSVRHTKNTLTPNTLGHIIAQKLQISVRIPSSYCCLSPLLRNQSPGIFLRVSPYDGAELVTFYFGRRILTACSSSSTSFGDKTAHAASMFSPRARRHAISFARETMAESIPLIAAQLYQLSQSNAGRRTGKRKLGTYIVPKLLLLRPRRKLFDLSASFVCNSKSKASGTAHTCKDM